MNEKPTFPASAMVGTAISVIFLALLWAVTGSALSLAITPVLAFWVLGVYLRGRLMEAPLDQWDDVMAFLNGRR